MLELDSPECERVRARLSARFGPAAEPWWQTLPELIATLSARWRITTLSAVGAGNTSLVVRCRCEDGSAAMLKLSPDPRLTHAEHAALSAWAGTGHVPAVWGYDGSLGALLLEAIANETPLSRSSVTLPAGEIGELIAALHSASPPAGVQLEPLFGRVDWIFDHWRERYAGTAVTEVVPLALLDRGRELARGLAADARQAVLLHGDLHPGNVLDGGARGLVAIDPRPCLGDPAFDVVDWVFWNTSADRWPARCRELADGLALDPDRVWFWCSAFAGLIAAARVGRGAAASDVEPLLALAA